MTPAARGAVFVLAAAAACGGGAPAAVSPGEPPPAGLERLLAMLPQGAQIVVEVDLARLRANPVVGAVVTRALSEPARPAPDAAPAAAWLRHVLRGAPPDEPPAEPGAASPLAVADQVVLAAYGVGTAQAATLTLLAAPRDVAGATQLAAGAYAIGPPEWIEQAQQRVALATAGSAAFAIRPAPELLALRAHAMPVEAPGASLRITARLSFDARIALVRQTGIDTPPAQLSAWGDVADDLALVIDCDAADPGSAPAGRRSGAAGGRRADPTHRLAGALRAMLATVADQPTIRALGLPPSLTGARLIARGTWVRAIIAVGPEHLRRVAERAAGMLWAPPVPPAAPSASPVAPRGDPPS